MNKRNHNNGIGRLARRLFWPRTLLRKTILAFIALFLLLGGAQYYLLNHLWNAGNQEVDQRLYWNLAEHFADELSPLVSNDYNVDQVKQELHRLHQLNPRVDIYLLDKTGRRIPELDKYGYRYGNNFNVPPVDLRAIDQFLAPIKDRSLPLIGDDPHGKRKGVIFSAAPMTIAGEEAYMYVVLHGRYFDRIAEGVEDFYAIYGGAVATAVVLLLVTLLSLVVYQIVTRRFQRLSDCVDRFAAGDFSTRAPVLGSDEIAQLGRSINRMLESLQQHLETEQGDHREILKDFVTNLQLPLAAVEEHLEIVLRQEDEARAIENRTRLQIALEAARAVSQAHATQDDPDELSIPPMVVNQ